MMESVLAELYCNIHKESQSNSNSISGCESGGSSKPFAAVLPGLSVQLESPKKKCRRKKNRDDQRRVSSQTRAVWHVDTFLHSLSVQFPSKRRKVDLLRVRKRDEEGEKSSRGDAGKMGSWRIEGPLLPPSHRLFPARLTHGKRQKLRRRDTP